MYAVFKEELCEAIEVLRPWFQRKHQRYRKI